MSANKKTSGPAQPPQPVVMKRGATALVKNRGTGFEGGSTAINIENGILEALIVLEYFADPPMTPDEATEEREEIYHP
jgi:hypothetical protein